MSPTRALSPTGIQIINRSSQLDATDTRRIAQACDIQLRRDVAKAWNIASPLRVGLVLRPGWYRCYLVDRIPEAPDALAYHSVDGRGTPFIRVGVTETLANGDTVSATTSHETVELQCDIYCQEWAYSSRLRHLVATEACDPVQAQSYRIRVPDGTFVPVSNFVTPDYFVDSTHGRPLDHQRTLVQPFSIAAGGYRIDMRAGAVTNTFAKGYPRAKKRQIAAGRGRTFWRHVTMAIAMR
jgi:hypothetical protein